VARVHAHHQQLRPPNKHPQGDRMGSRITLDRSHFTPTLLQLGQRRRGFSPSSPASSQSAAFSRASSICRVRNQRFVVGQTCSQSHLLDRRSQDNHRGRRTRAPGAEVNSANVGHGSVAVRAEVTLGKRQQGSSTPNQTSSSSVFSLVEGCRRDYIALVLAPLLP